MVVDIRDAVGELRLRDVSLVDDARVLHLYAGWGLEIYISTTENGLKQSLEINPLARRKHLPASR
jgi:hypothetical protein